MSNWLQNTLGDDFWSRTLIVLIDAGVKGFALLVLTGIAALAMRRAAAAARHLVWLLALAGLLILPAVSFVMPKWQLPILPSIATPANQMARSIPELSTGRDEIAQTGAEHRTAPAKRQSILFPADKDFSQSSKENPLPTVATQSDVAHAQSGSAFAEQHPGAFWILMLWLVPVLLILLPLLAGLTVVVWLRRSSAQFPGKELPELTRLLAATLGLQHRVILLCGRRGTMPMAAGLLRPAIFLPRDAESWPEEKRRVVLLHELAHIKRRDCLIHALARVAGALHWFDPLIWIALRRLRIERERACDDLVLNAGERPSAYADYLLEIARTLHIRPFAAAAAITMATRSQLEGRLLAVLDPQRRRTALNWWTTLAGAAALLVVAVPLGMTELAARDQNTRQMQTNVVIWQAIADESIAALLGLESGSLQKNSTYVQLDPITDGQLLEKLHKAKINGAELYPGNRMNWLKAQASMLPNHIDLLHNAQQELPDGLSRMEEMMCNGFAELELKGTQATIALDVQSTFGRLRFYSNAGGESQVVETGADFSKFKRSIRLVPDQAAIAIAPMSGGDPKKYFHFIVVQAVAVPDDSIAYLTAMTGTERWLAEGPKGELNEIGQAQLWTNANQQPAPKQVAADREIKVRNLANDEMVALTADQIPKILAIGQPGQWPHRWWDLAGRPVAANPAWQEDIEEAGTLAVVVKNGDHRGGVSMEFNGPGGIDDQRQSGSRTSSEYGDNIHIHWVQSSKLAEQIDKGIQLHLAILLGYGDWTEIGTIREGETVEADGGTFQLEKVDARQPRRDHWFGADAPGLVLIDGHYDYDPNWEIALVAADRAGRRTDVEKSVGSGMYHRREDRRWYQFIQMDKADIVKFVILKRSVVEYRIENLPLVPNAPISKKTSQPALEQTSSKMEAAVEQQDAPAPAFEPRLQQDAPIEEVIQALESDDINQWSPATTFLAMRKAEAKPAVPALVRALENSNKRESALYALREMGPVAADAVTALIEGLGKWRDHPAARWEAAVALASIGDAAVPALEQATQSSDTTVSIWAHAALARNADSQSVAITSDTAISPASPDDYYQAIDPVRSPHLHALGKFLGGKNRPAAEEALSAVKMLGAKAAPLAPMLDGMLQLEQPRFAKSDLIEALQRIGPAAQQYLRPVISAFHSTDLREQLEAVRAVKAIQGPDASAAVPGLIEIVRTTASADALASSLLPVLREEAVDALGNFGEKARTGMPVLIAALDDPEEKIRANAVEAIHKIDLANGQARPGLIRAMHDPSFRVQYAANAALLELGPLDIDIIRAFIQAVQRNAKSFSANGNYIGPSSHIVPVSEQFFAKLGPEHRYALDDLAELAESDSPGVKRIALQAIQRVGGAPESLVPSLIAGLEQQPQYGSTQECKQVLIQIGQHSRKAIPDLQRLLKSKVEDTRIAAAHVLALTGNPAERNAAVDQLIAFVEGSGPFRYENEAVRILAEIQTPEARRAIPAVTAWLIERKNPSVNDCHDLLQLDPQSVIALDRLERLVNEENRDFMDRIYGQGILVRHERNREQYLNAILESANDAEPRVRALAARTLLEVSSAPQDRERALKVVIELLESKAEDAWPRDVATQGFAQLGPADKGFIPQLQKLAEQPIDDQDYTAERIRTRARAAIAKIELAGSSE